MAAPSPSVTRVGTKKRSEKAAAAGQLDLFDDGSWEFTGNGETTPKDVANSIIEYENKQAASASTASEYQDVRPDALAKMLLDAPENQALNTQLNGSITDPIPAPDGQRSAEQYTFKAEVSTLKQAVALLAQHEAQLRAGLVTPDALANGKSTNLYTGNVVNAGLTLPYDPESEI